MKNHIIIKPGKNANRDAIDGYEGIYFIIGKRSRKQPLYIGRSRDVGRRIKEHEQKGSLISQIEASGDKVKEIIVLLCDASEAAERGYIKTFQPRYNSIFTGETKGYIQRKKAKAIRHKKYKRMKEWKKRNMKGE